MILKRIITLAPSKLERDTKHLYKVENTSKFVLGVYSCHTAKFYWCDKNGKRINNKPLSFLGV